MMMMPAVISASATETGRLGSGRENDHDHDRDADDDVVVAGGDAGEHDGGSTITWRCRRRRRRCGGVDDVAVVGTDGVELSTDCLLNTLALRRRTYYIGVRSLIGSVCAAPKPKGWGRCVCEHVEGNYPSQLNMEVAMCEWFEFI